MTLAHEVCDIVLHTIRCLLNDFILTFSIKESSKNYWHIHIQIPNLLDIVDPKIVYTIFPSPLRITYFLKNWQNVFL